MLPGVSEEFVSCPSFAMSGVDVRTGVGAAFLRGGAAGASALIVSVIDTRAAAWADPRFSTLGSGAGATSAAICD